MNLDKIAAHLRPKTPFEAVDLGFLLAQRFARPLWTAWFTLLTPIFLIIYAVAALTNSFWTPLLILWWLKPVYARIPVIVLSRAFFGSVPTHAQTMQAFPKAARKPSTIWQLTLGRFSIFRGFYMYINDLEGGTASQRRQRAKTLRNSGLDTAAYSLYFVALFCEIILFIALITFFSLIKPPSIEFNFLDSSADVFNTSIYQPAFKVFLLGCYTLVVSLVEPLFAAGNFGLYISRRVELEGWDIELTFRKIASRIQAPKPTIALVLLTAFFSTLVAFTPIHAHAHTPETPTPEILPPESPTKILITNILNQPEFGVPETKKTWQLRDKFDFTPKEKTENKYSLMSGQILTNIAWALAIVCVIVLIYLLFRYVSVPTRSKPNPFDEQWQQEFQSHGEQPKITHNLPEDIIAHARAARAAGDETRALTLLYAGMLRALQRDFNLELAPGLTAYETTRHVQKQNGPHEIVAEIANAWTARVFAHKTLDDNRFENMILRWQNTFSTRGTP